MKCDYYRYGYLHADEDDVIDVYMPHMEECESCQIWVLDQDVMPPRTAFDDLADLLELLFGWIFRRKKTKVEAPPR